MGQLGRCQVPEVHHGAVRSPCRTGREGNWPRTGLLCPRLPYRCQLCRVSFLFHFPCWAGCRQGSPHHPEDTQRNRSQQLLLHREDKRDKKEKCLYTTLFSSHIIYSKCHYSQSPFLRCFLSNQLHFTSKIWNHPLPVWSGSFCEPHYRFFISVADAEIQIYFAGQTLAEQKTTNMASHTKSQPRIASEIITVILTDILYFSWLSYWHGQVY